MIATPLALLSDRDHEANAIYGADLAHRFLKRLGISSQRRRQERIATTDSYPHMLLCEVAAIARLHRWEVAGILDLIDSNLPTADEALADRNRRYSSDPDSVLHGQAELLQRVLWAWRARCAPSAVAELGADLVVNLDGVDCLELLAMFAMNVAKRARMID